MSKKGRTMMVMSVMFGGAVMALGAGIIYGSLRTPVKVAESNVPATKEEPCNENGPYECGFTMLDIQTGEAQKVLKQKPEPPVSEWPSFSDKEPTEADQKHSIQVYMKNRDFWSGRDGTASVCSYYAPTDTDVAHIDCAEIGRLEITSDMRWLQNQPLY